MMSTDQPEHDRDQDLCNANVALNNAVFQVLSFNAGMFGEMDELNPALLRQYVDKHPELDLAAEVYRVVDDALADFGLLPSKAAQAAPRSSAERRGHTAGD
jgi:hypothetical protein